MKRFCVLMVSILLIITATSSAAADEPKTFEITVTGFSLIYNMCMEALNQSPDVSREWIDDSHARINLTDTSFCMLSTKSKSDFSDITEVLFTAVPQKESDIPSVRCSMVSTIYALDSELGFDFIADLVLYILPEKGEYISPYCKYTYEQTANIYMLLIVPR